MTSRLRHHQRGSRDQRSVELPHRRIEAERRLLQNPIPGSQGKLGLHPEHVIDNRPLRDRRPLRPARGARSEEHIGQSQAVSFELRSGPRKLAAASGDGRPLGVQAKGQGRPGLRQCRQHRQQSLLRQHHLDSRVREHPREALGRVLRIQRDVGSSRLQHREQAHDHLQGALQIDTHESLGADSQTVQIPGQPSRLGVELRVGESPIGGQDRQTLRRPRRLRREEPMEAEVRGRQCADIVPLHQEKLPLRRRQQRQLRQPPVRLRHRPGQQTREAAQQPLDGDALEQVLAVLQRPGETPSVSTSVHDSSNFAVPVSTGMAWSASPGSSRWVDGAFCSTNNTCTRGDRLRSRTGASSSTRRSNGTS